VSLVEPERIRAASAQWFWDVALVGHTMSGIEKARILAD
jgi:hypothetical protein